MSDFALCQTHQCVLKQVLEFSQPGSLVILDGCWGGGRSTILRAAHQKLGGCLLDAGDFLLPQVTQHPFKLEDVVFELLTAKIDQHETVLVDDFDLVIRFANHYDAPRHGFIDIVIKALVNQIVRSGRRLIVIGGNRTLNRQGHEIDIPALTCDDQEFLFRAGLLPEQADELNFDDIYAFAPKLTCREIALTCEVLHRREDLTTDQLIEYVARFNLESNVNLGQIEEVTFEDIKGIDEVIESLRIQLLLPLQHMQLTRDLELRPKRGVLLYGPPGTGKTSIGRALAHELGGKFFLLDGEASDRECDFGQYVYQVFAAAGEERAIGRVH